ncbi:MAG: protein kinase, partial [Ignavibacteriaceae bacterium]
MINTRYEIVKKLGEGRSSVYLCKDIEFPGKKYAIKILPKGIDAIERSNFIKEYFVLKKLEHPYIIRPFGLGTVVYVDSDDEIEIGSTFITLEYFDGNELLNSKEIYDEANLKEIIKQICSVLYYLHQSRYIYYDLKPENILVSFVNGKPEIRLIDLGLAEYSPSTSEYEIKGTSHYIAPELLRKESHNHSVDFYSLGIILYKIIYDRFPFEAKSELDIYKAAIENNFTFSPVENYSPELVNITKKLLEKDLTIRYSSALSVIKDLGFTLGSSVTKEFIPARVFSSREYAINILTKYISDKSSSEVFTVKGFDGVGKTSLLNKIHEHYPQAILISDIKIKFGAELIRYILRKIIFSESVFPHLAKEEKALVIRLMNKSQEEVLDDLRSTIILLSSRSKFILLIDDFNLFDQLTIDLLLEIVPFLQVNGIKVIISESSEHDFLSSKINNVQEVNVGPFTIEEMSKLLEESYSNDFPKKEMHDLILLHADLIPGNIKSFIKDLILLGIMKFSENGILFSDDEDKLPVLKKAHFAIYDLRLASLSGDELKAVKIISAIDTFIDLNTFSKLLNLSGNASREIIKKLEINNIIQQYNSGETIIFTSEAMKKHIYASLKNKKEFHSEVAKRISARVPAFNRLEESRQYELAGEYEICFNILMTEINESEKHSAFEYIRKILTHLLDLPLQKRMKDAVMIKLSEVFYKLGDMQSALAIIKDLKNMLSKKELDNNLFLIEGSALIASGEYETGKIVINNLLEEMDDINELQRLKVELAYADFELKRYDEARQQCDFLLNEKKLSVESKGRCYNLKGMIDIYQNNNMDSARENFQKAKQNFYEANEPIRVSGVEVNIGNIYNILAEYEKAEEHWQNASNINQSVGNLDQQGLLLQNFGVFYLDRQKYDLAIESYLKSQNIFLSIGKESSYGLI